MPPYDRSPGPIPTPSSPTKRNPGKEIIVNFAGGQYGAVNDEAAEKIAKKYNLEITKRPEKNDPTPIYLFSVKGDVGSNLSGIRNESGVRYVEPNSRGFIPEVGPDPIIEWEDNTMRAALNGQPLPPKPMVKPSNTPKDLVSYGGLQGGVAGPSYQEAMAQQTYNNLMQQQAAFLAAQNAVIPPSAGLAAAQNAANIQNQFQDYARGVGNLMPVQSQPTMGTMQTIAGPQPFLQTIAGPRPVPGQPPQAQNTANINQAMQTYQNLFNQGAANYQAAMQQPLSPPMGGAAPTKRKPSTSFRTPPIQAF